jgi:pyridinium-3,5-biscarboxylic acid mononucleotide synthase
MNADSEITLDLRRAARIGFDEAILCPGKTDEHLRVILDRAEASGVSLLLTRMSHAQVEALPDTHRSRIDYEPLSRTAYFGPAREPTRGARVCVVAAGTSDALVTREIERTLRYYGEAVTSFVDVGLAGAWRVLERIEEIRRFPVVIIVAGMDAALPTVVGGLVGSVVVAVPTSNGYGVAAGGKSALHAVLASCSPGLTVLNIDNGYGAACAAIRVCRVIDAAAHPG